MKAQKTLAIIKPDVVQKRKQGVVVQRILDEGFEVLAMRQMQLSLSDAQGFYAVHKGKGFFDELCTFMSRGPVVVLALRRDPMSAADTFPQDVLELRHYLGDPEPGQPTIATPGAGAKVPLWILGSSLYGAQLAAMLGLPYAFASHFAPEALLPALEVYRSTFKPSTQLAEPYAMVAAGVICAETDERARFLAGSSALSFLRLRQGRPGQVPSPEEAAAYSYSDLEQAFIADRQATQLIGAPDTVRSGLTELLKRTEADELMLTTQTYSPADRLRSFELVAQAVSAS